MNIGFLYALGAAVIWGLMYAVYQKILEGTSPLVMTFLSPILTALVMIPFVFFIKDPLKSFVGSGKINLLLLLLVITLGIAANFLIYSGIKKLDASTASIIEIAYPFFVVLFSYLLFKSTPNVYFFVGGALIFIGSIIIIKFA